MLSFASASPPTTGYYKKESVEMFVYLKEGCGKTYAQINNTPHLYSMWSRHRTCQRSIPIQVM